MLIWILFNKVGKLNKTSEPSLDSDSSSSDGSPGKLLGGYLAGLIEGDGSIIVPKTIRNQKGKLLYPVVKITFVEKDRPLALKIKEVIGGGTIVHPAAPRIEFELYRSLIPAAPRMMLIQYKRFCTTGAQKIILRLRGCYKFFSVSPICPGRLYASILKNKIHNY